MGKRVTLVGVGHVFDISGQVAGLIEYTSPDAIALELDRKRLQALLCPSRPRQQPFFYTLLATAQQRIAKKYGVTTGAEMKAALSAAQRRHIGVICIDMDVHLLFEKLWKRMSFKKKISLALGGLLSFGIRKKRVEAEVASFEADPVSYLEQLDAHFPEMASVFIDERNRFMAEQIEKALSIYEHLVVFVGEGHLSGLESLLKEKTSVTSIHLRQLREDSWCQQLTERYP
ncbi:MAG: TraB/GumN family protein [Candidatus Thermoplasmatota archaeon]|nr:TraB/GumN family protein [Candidatus Thermoplasmatota archaeon]